MTKKLKITRTAIRISKIPYNEQYYPDMTIEEAIEFESDPEEAGWKENFFEDEDTNIDIKIQIIEED